ncbi:MAG: LacI family DNA-binding transcriptional regulator [Bacteroidales bacterium]|nr:LacI family DNA-binding transcriptional regulator [Bacteroidales bacterium]
MSSPKRVSLAYIAETLGLSKTTVSWVLSGQGDCRGINANTQKRVLEFAAKCEYRPSYLAQSLSTGRTRTFGLIVSSLADPFYSHLSMEMVASAEAQGYTVYITTSETNEKMEDQLIGQFVDRGVEGVIITPAGVESAGIERVLGKTSIVLADRKVPGLAASSVVADNEDSAYRLVSHLIGKGNRKIALMTTLHRIDNLSDRCNGYRRAMAEAGYDVPDSLICKIDKTASREEIFERLGLLFEQHPDVDGIFFTTHVFVVPTYAFYRKMGKKINGGANWACIHSLPEFEFIVPQMSIAQLPTAAIAKASIDLLIAAGEGETDPQEKVFECEMKLN